MDRGNTMIGSLQHCLRDRSAGVAVMFAVTALPVIGIIGVGIDLGLATQAKAQLDAASDAAALAAAKVAADAFSAGQSNYIATGQTAGVEWFKSQANSVFGPGVPTPVVTVTQNGAVFSSNITYQSSIKPYFAPLFGVNTVALGGLSSATITATTYVAVTFLLDNSSSMLIAATQAGVDKLNSLTPVPDDSNRPKDSTKKGPKNSKEVPSGLGGLQCAFACHWDSGNNDYYGLARDNSIKLRFDVLQDAVASAINQMIKQEKVTDQFSVAIYTFGDKPNQAYPADKKQDFSTDLDGGVTAAKGIETPVVEDKANTDFPKVMKELVKNSTAAGDGSSPNKRKKALIIVTDGLADYEPRKAPDSKGPINPADCDAMKKLGYSIYVLYTTYITTPSNLVLPFDNIDLLGYINGTKSPAMIPSLQACASASANFAQASDPDAISASMTQLLQSAIGNSGRYTQ